MKKTRLDWKSIWQQFNEWHETNDASFQWERQRVAIERIVEKAREQQVEKTLSTADQQKFVAALLHPPKPNKALKKAARKRNRMRAADKAEQSA